MSDELKQAKAAAKAAQAEAKALRPFYKKKRWWLVGAIVVIVAASAAGGGGSSMQSADNSDTTSDTSGTTQDTISTGLGSKDATGDVVSVKCTPSEYGMTDVVVRLTNNSSKPSDYFVTVVAESADGAEQFDDTMVSAMGLKPGQSTNAESGFLKEIPAGAVCKVTEVQRTASN